MATRWSPPRAIRPARPSSPTRTPEGLSQRIANGPSDLSPVVNAVISAATEADPALRYPVAPHLTEVLNPALHALADLH
ncbi:MAG TPA: hypothetical protein VGJ60_16250, partial [Chloroflexota bacterium]